MQKLVEWEQLQLKWEIYKPNQWNSIMANNINTQDFVNRKVQRINLANNIKKVIELNEGKKYITYEDSKGIMHIGIGFNLEDKDNQRFLKDSLNLTINDLKKEGFKLNENQVTKLYNHSISKAYMDAKKI